MKEREQSLGPLGRDAVERVLKRAIELQANERQPADQLDELQVLQLAQELGLHPDHLQRALAEERAGLSDATQGAGRLEAWLGPRRLSAGRSVPGDAPELLDALARQMESREGLQIIRRTSDELMAEPMPGALGWLRSILARGGGALRQADSIRVKVQPLEGEDWLIAVHADLEALRSRLLGRTAASLGVGAVAAAILAGTGLGAAGLLFVLPGILGAWLTRSEHQKRLKKIQDGLEKSLATLQPPADAKPPQLTEAIEGARRLGTKFKLLSEAFLSGLNRPDPFDKK